MRGIAVFVDLQGTLGGDGLDDIRSLTLYPFAIEAIKLLNERGVLVIGVTNQSHISQGTLSMDEYLQKVEELKDQLAEREAHLDAVYCCPHGGKDNCGCRKPQPGMIEQARQDYDIQLDRSYVVGDMGMADMLLAANVGEKGVLVLTGVGRGSLNEYRHTWQDGEADHVAANVLEAARWIAHDIGLR